MKKHCIAVFFLVILCLASMIPAMAEEAAPPRLVDNAGVLTSSEASRVQEKLDKISEKHGMDIVIVTTKSLDGKSPQAYADDFYDYNHYRKDGILLLLCPTTRDWYISTTGYGITAVTDAGRRYMSKQFLPALGDDNYAKGFTIFAKQCDKFIGEAKSGTPYDIEHLPTQPLSLIWIPICLFVGFIIAVICVDVMKSNLKSARSQPTANTYIRSGSMRITEKKDLFLYHTVTKRPKPKDTGSSGSRSRSSSGGSRTHVSSSGTRHGGGGGKY